MGGPQQTTVPEENRFALAPCERGIALFRATGNGLVCEVSADGVSWEPGAAPAGGALRLWPACSGEAVANADLFCMDAAGMIIPVRAEQSRLSAGEAVSPIRAAGPWYDGPPEPHHQAIIQDGLAGAYRVFFCARRSTGRRPERRGCIGVALSRDLRRWRVEPPIFAPNRFPRLFSPHLVSEEGHTVLFYSTPEQGDLRAVRFAIAPHLDGPYERTEPDVLAGDFRAIVHTVRLGPRRLVFFGRARPRELHLASISRPGQLDFHPDGRPFVRFYDRLLGLLGPTLFQTDGTLNSGETLVRMLPRHGANFRYTARIRSEGARSAGLVFRATPTGRDNITVWMDFDRSILSVRRGVKGRLLGRVRRPLLVGNEYVLSVWVEGVYADVYLDGEWVLTFPAEGRRSGGFGLTVRGGKARFRDVVAEIIQAS